MTEDYSLILSIQINNSLHCSIIFTEPILTKKYCLALPLYMCIHTINKCNLF